MNWYKIAQISSDIIIDMDNYSQQIHTVLFNLIETPFDSDQCSLIKQKTKQYLDNFIRVLHENNIHNYDNILNGVNDFNFIEKNYDTILDNIWGIRGDIFKTIKPNFDTKIIQSLRDTITNLSDFKKCVENYYFTEDNALEEKNRLIKESFDNMNKIKNELSRILSSVNQYKGKIFPITIEASEDYNENGRDVNLEKGTNSALLYVGNKDYYIYMSIYWDGGKIQILGDEVEDFGELEDEFGEEVNDIKPFYNLIRTIIKNPNRIENSVQKTTTVYTARPIKDFSIFENASNVPVDIFVSTNYNFVEGFAIDNKPRDIWKIRISDNYLINDQTNNPDFIFQVYNPSGEKEVPIKRIQFIERIDK